MNKRLVVSVAFVILIIVVAISFSSYQANLLEMHDKTKYLEKIAAKQSPLLNLDNGSHPLGSENASVNCSVLFFIKFWVQNVFSTMAMRESPIPVV